MESKVCSGVTTTTSSTSEMARRSDRRRARHLKAAKGLRKIAIILFATSEDEDDELVALLVARQASRRERLANGRLGPRGRYDRAKSTDFFELLVEHFTERQFKAWIRYVCNHPSTLFKSKLLKFIRMSRESFWHLHELIQDDPVFLGGPRSPQRPVAQQLAAFLCYVGAEPGLKHQLVDSVQNP